MRRIVLFIISFFNVAHTFFPHEVWAATPTPISSFDPNRGAGKLNDPTQAFTLIGPLFETIITVAMFAGAITALIFIIIGAVQYITAGDGQGAAKARSTITYAAVGLIMLAMTYVFILFYNSVLPAA
jgi:hypothetical protein